MPRVFHNDSHSKCLIFVSNILFLIDLTESILISRKIIIYNKICESFLNLYFLCDGY